MTYCDSETLNFYANNCKKKITILAQKFRLLKILKKSSAKKIEKENFESF